MEHLIKLGLSLFFKKLYLVLAICALNTPFFAQQNKIDSLRNLIKNDNEDSVKVNHLNDFGSILMYNNTDTSILLGKQALALAEKIQWKAGIANSFRNLGVYNFLNSDYPKALAYFNKALHLFELLDLRAGIAGVLGNMGALYSNQGEYTKANYYYFKPSIYFLIRESNLC